MPPESTSSNHQTHSQARTQRARKRQARKQLVPRPSRVAEIRANAPFDPEQDKLLSKGEVIGIVGLSYPTLWLRMRNQQFPRARDVGGKIFWLQSEINDWLRNLPIKRIKGDPQ